MREISLSHLSTADADRPLRPSPFQAGDDRNVSSDARHGSDSEVGRTDCKPREDPPEDHWVGITWPCHY